MHYYPKISCPFLRVNPKDKMVDLNQYSDKYADLLSNVEFSATEKVDGKNTNIIYDGNNVKFEGHTDKTTWTPEEETWIKNKFINDGFIQMCEQQFGEKTVQFCGELIGPKIQSNIYKLDDYKFIVFDIKINNVFISREFVKEITNTLYMDTIDIYTSTLMYCAFNYTNIPNKFKEKDYSASDPLYLTIKEWAEFMQSIDKQLFIGSRFNPNVEIEGFVIRPRYELIKPNGERVIYKIKYKDILGRSPRISSENSNETPIVLQNRS